MIETLYHSIKSGEHRAIAKAITLIESNRPEDRKPAMELLSKLQLGRKPNSIRIGISGIPGVGKSTFIDKLTAHILEGNPTTKIAILTIDPSSPMEGGSILADRLRMTDVSNHPNVFIRPTPTSGTTGGLSRRTRESMFLLEAAGFEVLIIETVGVGQTEFHVASLVDIFLLLQMPSTGDEWQAMKKGILELADLIIVNKADGDLKNEAKKLTKILEMSFHSQEGPSVLSCSSTLNEGIKEIWDGVNSKIAEWKEDNDFYENRIEQNIFWFEEELLAQFKEQLYSNARVSEVLDIFRKELADHEGVLFSGIAEKAVKALLRKELTVKNENV